jgi:hypothetical protein
MTVLDCFDTYKKIQVETSDHFIKRGETEKPNEEE